MALSIYQFEHKLIIDFTLKVRHNERMSNAFAYDVLTPKQKLKKALPFIGIGALVVAVLAILILPSRFASIANCNDLGLGGGLTTILTGSCDKSFDEIVFVVGDTQNSPAPSLNYPEYIETALNLNKASITAMSVSNPRRNPKLITDYDSSKKVKDFVNQTVEYISSMKATNEGADYLGAIQTAADSTEDKNKTLVYVIGSGLSDRGLLDFANNNLLGQDFSVDQITDRIAERLNDNTALKGVTIVWDGLGQTAPPQQYLSKESTDKLKQIYSAIFTELGASRSNIRFKNKLNGDASVDTNVYVKTSSTGEEPLNWTKQYTGDVTSAFQFVGDSAAFVDQQATDAGISEIVDVASGHPNATITVTAYMSRGNCARQDVDQVLLDSRLSAINSLLVARGIDPARITLTSGGFGDAPECDAWGNYIETEAAKNRRVDVNVKN